MTDLEWKYKVVQFLKLLNDNGEYNREADILIKELMEDSIKEAKALQFKLADKMNKKLDSIVQAHASDNEKRVLDVKWDEQPQFHIHNIQGPQANNL